MEPGLVGWLHGQRPLLRHRFPPEIISYAVWLYFRFCFSFRFRDIEELLASRGVIVTNETVR